MHSPRENKVLNGRKGGSTASLFPNPPPAHCTHTCNTAIMDGITAASTVVGLIAGVLDIAEVVYDYARNTIGANKEKEELLSEIEATNNLLTELQGKANVPQWKNTFGSMQKLDGPLQRYRSALEAAEAKLRPAKTSLGKAAKRAVWHFQKDEFAEILAKISRSKADLGTLLNLYLLLFLIQN
jgi:hypothetical protein